MSTLLPKDDSLYYLPELSERLDSIIELFKEIEFDSNNGISLKSSHLLIDNALKAQSRNGILSRATLDMPGSNRSKISTFEYGWQTAAFHREKEFWILISNNNHPNMVSDLWVNLQSCIQHTVQLWLTDQLLNQTLEVKNESGFIFFKHSTNFKKYTLINYTESPKSGI